MSNKKIDRRTQILQALAQMLESSPGARITTAALAKQVGVSEAALYRHFPSKAKMFEGLIEFIEESLFSRINRIIQEESDVVSRIEMMMTLILGFAQQNPGMCRLLTADALSGETERLRVRIAQLFDRIETQLKQVIREADLKQGLRSKMGVAPTADFLLAVIEGKVRHYVRSEFKTKPMEAWQEQWPILAQNLMQNR
ncbi:nucleoid occlusion factor SlmA [Marinomonas aquiplantarum]|uniref:Nucleoid occlusion factor SlmA n=1 Tax=Marinomonas aquiplantarum TaxID=491951 RepID=A0A366D3I6_9GAMM|nr:nucleoid occlusion factor SlmA [Marinomonas aquiplantarum]RBO84622.1 TetR family transcriptional regulator [Marinomonas aquiplantarum]